MTYETMAEARDRPHCLIPVSFTVSDEETYELKSIKLCPHEDPNENTTDSTRSATQNTRCYKFTDGNIALNIIDTPGIADTEGIERDNKNMENLLHFISNYREINAICVLLKPNNARVDAIFNHLNKSAADNILFLFTNARSTQYAPGESGPSLKALLETLKTNTPNVDIPYNRSTIYCFDNEAFRYLVATVPPNDMVFSEDLTQEYIRSWQQSVNECDRLLERIVSLKPHQVMDTLSLNNAKQNIQLLIEPLVDISKNIAENIIECEKQMSKLEKYNGNIQELERELYIPYLDMVPKRLDHPNTVCTAKGCYENQPIPGTSNTRPVYPRPCHSPCYVSCGSGNILGNRSLLDCRAFNRYSKMSIWSINYIGLTVLYPDFGPERIKKPLKREVVEKCQSCNHSYMEHKHVYYEYEVGIAKSSDESKRLTTNTEALEAQQLQLKELKGKVDELTTESTLIIRKIARNMLFIVSAFMEQLNVTSRIKPNLPVLTLNASTSRTTELDGCISLEDIDKKIYELCGLKWNEGLITKMLADQQQYIGHAIAK
ncbi:unnamed protein product [Oppiella nova]|uniref:DUF8206 domain-containing protein n=1 Tax=Oppiella nova TaxID=334625 RepID=A0A7R9M5P8_9ACAR|nr:unnamed protein product [Oppiella nova]CAG2171236.1 unnamed protein product [Oppiella nova]